MAIAKCKLQIGALARASERLEGNTAGVLKGWGGSSAHPGGEIDGAGGAAGDQPAIVAAATTAVAGLKGVELFAEDYPQDGKTGDRT